MNNINKDQLNPEIFKLYNDYAHSRMTKREFLNKLSVYAVGGLTVANLINFLLPNYAMAIQVPESDNRLKVQTIQYDSPQGGGKISAQLAMPSNIQGKLGAVVVVHENRGLNPYIADVGRRAALAGFITLAPDALSPLGGYPGDDDKGREMQASRDRDEMLRDFLAAITYLQQHPQSNGKVGIVGFCFGGWVSNMAAAEVPDLAAAVPYYGRQAPLEVVPQINAPLLLHFAEHDDGVNSGWSDYEQALQQHNKRYLAYHYAGTNHGFHNDSTPRFDKAAAELSWQRTLAFLGEHLR
ncbi:dienelactone hydrolase family protein [Lonepinella koalarum]|uniref:dienelactone hydrolase family protein n=1 Tax=Lonepinella koalarum TaxID=53417 RepID=UPI0011E4020D|nr:dienelactone hydrolase family protein [Lonepinella koalarum]TYG34672.1 dienelactone hydrolase family protein [Lonepinella koalarum]